MFTRHLLVFIALVFLAGCSSGSSTGESLNGNYFLSATSLTATDVNGGSCVDASGTLTIVDDTLDGTIMTTVGELFDIVGTIDSNGIVSGGFAQSGQNAARFNGTISGTSGSGTWNDLFECSGAWEAIRNAE